MSDRRSVDDLWAENPAERDLRLSERRKQALARQRRVIEEEKRKVSGTVELRPIPVCDRCGARKSDVRCRKCGEERACYNAPRGINLCCRCDT